jgi:hypothetical protein
MSARERLTRRTREKAILTTNYYMYIYDVQLSSLSKRLHRTRALPVMVVAVSTQRSTTWLVTVGDKI